MFVFNPKLLLKTGTENGWTWEKYADGRAICYGSFTKNITVTSQWGNQYTGIFGSYNFPTNLFIDVPSIFKNTSNGFSCWLMASGYGTTKEHTEQIACVRPSNVTPASSITIDILAIGRWK